LGFIWPGHAILTSVICVDCHVPHSENNWQTDPASKDCAELAIAARMDLSAGPLGTLQANGAVDAKLSSATWMSQNPMAVLAKSGPTVETQKPFTWSTSQWASQPHEGMPDTFNFDWQTFTVIPRPSPGEEEAKFAHAIPTRGGKAKVNGGVATE
jgi:hypothetical protein